MAVEGTAAVGLLGRVDVLPDLGDNGCSEGHVRDEVAIHDIDVQPVGALCDGVGAGLTQGREVGGEDRGRYYRGGSHCYGEYGSSKTVCVRLVCFGVDKEAKRWWAEWC